MSTFFDYSSTQREWNAKWIWDQNDTNRRNTWMILRKTFELDEVPSSVIANIAVESRYWLYVNGEQVVFEGGLKRGINAFDSFYDEVEIAPYLKKGKNVIAALGWYWGTKGECYSCNFAGKAGFIFDAEINGDNIVSDSSWKVHKNDAYVYDDGSVPGVKEPQPNYRLPECNVFYDARLDMGDWKAADYDDSSWENAKELGSVPCQPWNKLHRRPIPFLKDFGLKDYNNSTDYVGYTTEKEETLDLYLDYNAQLTPYLEIDASEAGLKIDILTDNYADPAGNGLSIKNAYVTVKGEQAFEGLSWMPGEHVYYTIPAGITIKALKFRETGYNAEFRGYFRCDDEFLNKLWKQSRRTLYVTMRDNFMDCPDRERAQWWGDVTNEMMMFMYCLDTNAYALYEKGLYTKMGFCDTLNTPKLRTVVPAYKSNCELPMQELAGICGMWEYYLYTGNLQAIKDVYPYVANYMIHSWCFWVMDNNLVSRYTGTWDWPDWGPDPDFRPLENAWYYRALIAYENMALAAGIDSDLEEIRRRKACLEKGFQKFWTSKGYKTTENDNPDDRCNAVALFAGLADEKKKPVILRLLEKTRNSSPYMEKYVLDALCVHGKMKDVQRRIKERYHDMTDSELSYSTLWEFWDKTKGTKNHAWSGGPLITMSKYMAGIRPLTPGYETYEISPDMGSLKHIEALVPSVKGDISVTLDKKRTGFEMTAEGPKGVSGIIAVPEIKKAEETNITVNGINVIENGSKVNDADGIAYKGVVNGRHTFEFTGAAVKIIVK